MSFDSRPPGNSRNSAEQLQVSKIFDLKDLVVRDDDRQLIISSLFIILPQLRTRKLFINSESSHQNLFDLFSRILPDALSDIFTSSYRRSMFVQLYVLNPNNDNNDDDFFQSGESELYKICFDVFDVENNRVYRVYYGVIVITLSSIESVFTDPMLFNDKVEIFVGVPTSPSITTIN